MIETAATGGVGAGATTGGWGLDVDATGVRERATGVEERATDGEDGGVGRGETGSLGSTGEKTNPGGFVGSGVGVVDFARSIGTVLDVVDSSAPTLLNSVRAVAIESGSFLRANGGGEANVNDAAGDVVDRPNANDGGEEGINSLGGEGTVDDGGRESKSGVDVPSFDSTGESSFSTRRLFSARRLSSPPSDPSAPTFPNVDENFVIRIFPCGSPKKYLSLSDVAVKKSGCVVRGELAGLTSFVDVDANGGRVGSKENRTSGFGDAD